MCRQEEIDEARVEEAKWCVRNADIVDAINALVKRFNDGLVAHSVFLHQMAPFKTYEDETLEK